MNYTDIAIFKHFIVERDLRRQFIKKYNKSIGMTKNPPSVEKYLSNTDPKNVIVNGLKNFFPNEAFGFDFWNNLDMAWQKYYENILADHSVNQEHGLATLSGFYAILRENWDNDKQHIFETVPQAMRRLCLGSVEEEEQSKEDAPLIEFPDEQEEDLGIEFIDIDTSSRRSGNALRKGIMSVNTRSASWRTTINRTDSKDIDKGKFLFVRLGKIKDDLVMMFNYQEGVNVVLNSDGYININSRKFVEALHKALDIKAELIYLNIEKYSERVNSLTYKITKQQ